MTAQEIKKELETRNITLQDFAAQLGINADNLGRILSGKRPLTEQLEKHITMVLAQEKVHPCIFTVRLPAGIVHDCLPTWGEMLPSEREAALVGIVAKALEKLAENGSKRFTAEQLEAMRAAFSKTGIQHRLRIELVEDVQPPAARLTPCPMHMKTQGDAPTADYGDTMQPFA